MGTLILMFICGGLLGYAICQIFVFSPTEMMHKETDD